MPKKTLNINDTSLFAELVKGKHKREKVLKELLLSSDARDSSKVINVDAPNRSEAKAPTNGDLTDIPIPPASNGISAESSTSATDSTDHAAPPPPPPEPNHPFVIKKSKATELPMPPGVIVPSELRTPSPPKEAGPSKKMRLLDMPMPPMIPGTEDLSNDENDIMFGRQSQKQSVRGNGTPKVQRPKIINRRRSDNSVGNWGERCVEVFQIMVQIGEGKVDSCKRALTIIKATVFQVHTERFIKHTTLTPKRWLLLRGCVWSTRRKDFLSLRFVKSKFFVN